MAKRFRIGLNYFFNNSNNSGIVNYIYNIVSALNTLDDAEKPELVVFYSANAPIDYLQSIGYPYADYILFRQYPSNFLVRKFNSAVKRTLGIDLFQRFTNYGRIDCLYPYFEFSDFGFKDFKHKIHWLVDFNNRAFPQHYEDKGLTATKAQEKITATTDKVVLSSNALFDELKQYHPHYRCQVKLLRFASSITLNQHQPIGELLAARGIDVPYMMSPNQFWEHKNQIVVLKAIRIIKEQRPDFRFKILFTGSLEVNRGKGLYIDQLRSFIQEHQLEEFISFLGVVDRDEQLALMKHSSALIQPSLYEGWSTLVEEAKALNKFIILSDLPVHREQINENVAFFNPHDAAALASKILAQFEAPYVIKPLDYSKNVKEYGKVILAAFKN